MSPMLRKVNRDFFKCWTPEMAYVLGFFAADGYMWLSGRGACFFGFNITDRDLLRSIRDAMDSTHKIAHRIQNNEKWKDLFRLQIGSKDMYGDLMDLGMTTAKTHTLQMPYVPDEYIRDFIRGYFDGDGHVWVGKMHKDRGVGNMTIQSVFTSGSKEFLLSMRDVLYQMGLGKGTLIEKQKAYRLQYSVKDSIMLSHLMYDKCENKLFLKRKKVKFDTYIKSMRS